MQPVLRQDAVVGTRRIRARAAEQTPHANLILICAASIIAAAQLVNSLPFAVAADSTPRGAVSTVDFARDVQPVLARRCFRCHGPDKAEAGLRLDLRDRAFARLESGAHALVAGKVAESELYKRISSHDADERMPPEGKPLTTTEIDAIRHWIAEGATWETHWAFRPLVAQKPPSGAQPVVGSQPGRRVHSRSARAKRTDPRPRVRKDRAAPSGRTMT